MQDVGQDYCQRIHENRRRFLERYSVLAGVCGSLLWIPREPHVIKCITLMAWSQPLQIPW